MLQQGVNEEGGSKNNDNNINNYMYPQSSMRWTPTSEQLMILKDLYNNKGIRKPSTEQIEWICDKLRQFGRIEGKNVFYWFHNHKYREKKKNRSLPTAANVDPHVASYGGAPYDNRAFLEQEEGGNDQNPRKLETLILFPLHAGDCGGGSNDVNINNYGISLELNLNSGY